jgi:hypothetical protein
MNFVDLNNNRLLESFLLQLSQYLKIRMQHTKEIIEEKRILF